jgi:hypothetical protein
MSALDKAGPFSFAARFAWPCAWLTSAARNSPMHIIWRMNTLPIRLVRIVQMTSIVVKLQPSQGALGCL